jgi:ATP-dependent Clp protease ATP-binding subunit ClpC
VIDEAGAAVRLKSMTKPPDLKEIDGEIERSTGEGRGGQASQDFERAAELRDQADEAEEEGRDHERVAGGSRKKVDGVVDEEVIAEVVSKMTGIPLTRLEKEEAAGC